MDKRILFILFVLVGSIVVAISINYSLGTANIAEYVALFTSVSTAIYAILAQPKERTEPLLRIVPTLKRHSMVIMGDSLGQIVGLNVWIQNIGYSVAKDIEIRCQLIPDASIPLKDNGVYKISFLTPKDPPVQYQVVEEADSEKLLSQQLIIEASYLNEDNKKQKPTKNVYSVKELQ
jgi:hypothetical protein